MIENIILWLIIGAAAIYCGRRAYQTLSGRSKGCCGDCDPSRPAPQQIIPDLTKKDQKRDDQKDNP